LFARGVLTQMTSLLRLEDSSMYLGAASGFAARDRHDDFVIVAGTGDFARMESRLASEVLLPGADADRRAARERVLFRRVLLRRLLRHGDGGRHVLFLRILQRQLTAWSRTGPGFSRPM
jgi:Domain of unknown function (DUF3369).